MYRELTTTLADPSTMNTISVVKVLWLFSAMQEHTMHAIMHAAFNAAPTIGTKPFMGLELGALLKIVILSHHANSSYRLAPGTFPHLAAQAQTLLESKLTSWSPKYSRPASKQFVSYNRTSFWLSALRILRNLATHQSLYFVKSATDTVMIPTFARELRGLWRS